MTTEAQSLITFRVHYDGGGHVDIEAESPNDAREIFKKRYPRIIVNKVKQVKGGAA
jgi:hypothetical protein